jgi:hypothetical protein
MSDHKAGESSDAQEWQEALVMVLHQLGIVEIRIKPETITELSSMVGGKQPVAMVWEKDGCYHVAVAAKESLKQQ